MKRFTYLMISIILFCSIAVGCNKTESTKSGFKYGTYKIEKVKHLPIFSSSSPDFFLEQNEGVLFVVKNGSFSTDTTNSKAPSVHRVDYDNVKYVEENLNNVILTMGKDVGDIGKIDLSSYNEKLCFKVMANSEDTGFRIYCFDKEVWIAYFSWFGEKKDIWTANYIFSVSYKESQAEAITNNEIENQQLLRNISQNSVEVKSEEELIRQYINSTQGVYRELNVSYNSDYGTKMLYIYGDGAPSKIVYSKEEFVMESNQILDSISENIRKIEEFVIDNKVARFKKEFLNILETEYSITLEEARIIADGGPWNRTYKHGSDVNVDMVFEHYNNKEAYLLLTKKEQLNKDKEAFINKYKLEKRFLELGIIG